MLLLAFLGRTVPRSAATSTGSREHHCRPRCAGSMGYGATRSRQGAVRAGRTGDGDHHAAVPAECTAQQSQKVRPARRRSRSVGIRRTSNTAVRDCVCSRAVGRAPVCIFMILRLPCGQSCCCAIRNMSCASLCVGMVCGHLTYSCPGAVHLALTYIANSYRYCMAVFPMQDSRRSPPNRRPRRREAGGHYPRRTAGAARREAKRR